MNALIFEENQSFRQPWLWALMLASLAGLVAAVILVQENREVLLIVLGFSLAAFLLVFSMKLTVQVEDKFISIRFFPLWKKTIPLAEIAHFKVRTYRPILEYGGWGIRYSPYGKGWAYNVRGNQGVQLELASGKRILIGSQKAEELARAIGEGKQ